MTTPAAGGASFETPSTLTMIGRSLLIACPVCRSRGLFHRWFTMVEDCPRCGLHFERIEGHWIGAIGINTIVSFGILLITVVVSLIATFPDFPVGRLMIFAAVVSIIVPSVFFPASRTMWTAIDLAMRPLEAHEVDWTKVRP